MALEQVFDCPRTISAYEAVRWEGFCDWLEERRFSRSTARKHLSNVSHLGKYLAGLAPATRATISGKDIEGFFQTYPSECRNRGSLEKHLRCVRWSRNRFVDFLRQEGLFTASPQEVANYQPLLDGYLEWMRDDQDAAAGTLTIRGHSIAQFLQALGQEATVEGLGKLSCEKVEQFFLDYARSKG